MGTNTTPEQVNQMVRNAIKTHAPCVGVSICVKDGVVVLPPHEDTNASSWKFSNPEFYVMPDTSQIVVDGKVYSMDKQTRELVEHEQLRRAANNTARGALEHDQPRLLIDVEGGLGFGWFGTYQGYYCVLYPFKKIGIWGNLYDMDTETFKMFQQKKEEVQKDEKERQHLKEQMAVEDRRVMKHIRSIIIIWFCITFAAVPLTKRCNRKQKPTKGSVKNRVEVTPMYAMDSVNLMPRPVASFCDYANCSHR